MNWVPRNLGAEAIVFPGFAIQDHARTAIQLNSDCIVKKTVFMHLGWREVDGEQVYLHATGAIGKVGSVSGIETDLEPSGLANFALSDPPKGITLQQAIQASLGLLDLAQYRVMAPVIAAIYRAPLG